MTTEFVGYIFCENLGLTPTQRNTLVDSLKLWGLKNASPYPNLRNHWRTRLDGEAVIFEGCMDADLMTAIAIRARLAALFGVPNTSVTYATTQTAFGPMVTYTYNSVARLRFGVFGGVGATWAESWAQVLAYLAANRNAWESAQV